MNDSKGFLAVRMALGLLVALACLLWAFGQRAGNSVSPGVGLEGLRDELGRAQFLAPPGGAGSLDYDAGRFIFAPDGGPDNNC